MVENTKFIFVTGGVLSSLGKGVSAASLGALLQSQGYKVRLRKFDPYLNVDPGTMSPLQHGEVFVTEDGGEADLDLGYYERFTGISAQKSDSITTGQVYSRVISQERRGDFLGATVQVIPHITDAIKESIFFESEKEDFIICEIGGTVGDIESLPFLEAIRQIGHDLGQENTMFIHVTLVPYVMMSEEFKTKPTQHSIKELRGLGIQPTFLFCRSDYPMTSDAKRKIAQFCNVRSEYVLDIPNLETIYSLPNLYHHQALGQKICDYFKIPYKKEGPPQGPSLEEWNQIAEKVLCPKETLKIGIIGKYISYPDAYKSILAALNHGGIANNVKIDIQWIDAEAFNLESLKNVQGILVPGGFGSRGMEGKIQAIQIAREKKIPFLGICFGMQLAVVEYARHVLGLSKAGTTEGGPTPDPVIGLMTEWMKEGSTEKRQEGGNLGGTMRLGVYPCMLSSGTKAYKAYGQDKIMERHRHRYEVNIHYKKRLEEKGLVFSGLSPDGKLTEVVELADHPWFVGVQFHPEFKSRPFGPHPLFVGFVNAAHQQKKDSTYE